MRSLRGCAHLHRSRSAVAVWRVRGQHACPHHGVKDVTREVHIAEEEQFDDEDEKEEEIAALYWVWLSKEA